jgi:hypothetical protein
MSLNDTLQRWKAWDVPAVACEEKEMKALRSSYERIGESSRLDGVSPVQGMEVTHYASVAIEHVDGIVVEYLEPGETRVLFCNEAS